MKAQFIAACGPTDLLLARWAAVFTKLPLARRSHAVWGTMGFALQRNGERPVPKPQ
jgi:hypothetical protein